MSREFVPVVTKGMMDVAFGYGAREWDCDDAIRAALAHPDYQRQLRAWAAEEMRGLVKEWRERSSAIGDNSHREFDAGRERAYDNCADELDAALDALPLVPEWLPIETAPKDGRDILLAVVERGFMKCAVGGWDDEEESWVEDFRGKGNFNYVPATHWMPLPAAPAPKEGV